MMGKNNKMVKLLKTSQSCDTTNLNSCWSFVSAMLNRLLSNLPQKSNVKSQRFEMGSLLWMATEVQEWWGHDWVLQVCTSTSSWQSLQ